MDEQLEQEEWRDIAGYEGLYQVSDLGRVKSLDRVKVSSNNGKEYQAKIKGMLLAGDSGRGNHKVILRKEGVKNTWFQVSKLVASAFLKKPNEDSTLIHIDGNLLNNVLSNLKWVSSKIKAKRDKQLIALLQAYTVNPDCVPVELVKQLDRVRKAINAVRKPVFVDDAGNTIDYTHWEEFAYTGLNPSDFVLTDFYLTGFDCSWEDEKDDSA